MMKVFHVTHKKFLTTIDHIDYHPSQIQNNTTRTKRSALYDMYGQYHTPTRILTPSEEDFLNAFMKALYKIIPSLHNKLSCMKRVGIFAWILGWGVSSNARNIAKIKDNLHTLHQQNQQQDKQIKQLAKYLNLTMHQVDKHNEMLYELDTKMLILNKTLQQIIYTLDIMQYESNLLHYFQNRIYRVLCHTCSRTSKARPFRFSKSSVLDSMVLRERHVIGIRRLYFHNRTVNHSMYSMGRLKP